MAIQRLDKDEILRNHNDIEQLFKLGKYWHGHHFDIIYRFADSRKVLFAVSRKAETKVVRNVIKKTAAGDLQAIKRDPAGNDSSGHHWQAGCWQSIFFSIAKGISQFCKPCCEIMKNILLIVIRFYQKALSPLFPPSCRFYPTCSTYTYQAIEKYGVIKGSYLGAKRILKCHPFHSGGYDPLQ